MDFNYGFKKKKFDAAWKKLRKIRKKALCCPNCGRHKAFFIVHKGGFCRA